MSWNIVFKIYGRLSNVAKKGKAKERLKGIPKKLFANKKRGITTIAVLVILVAGIAVSAKLLGGEAQALSYQTAAVERGDITTAISGTGTISAKDEYAVVPLVEGEILAAPFEEGDTIKKGDLLYQIDSSDAANGIARAELSLEKTRLSASQNTDSVSSLTVKAETAGVLQNFTVKVGDDVKSGEVIGQIVNSDKMILTVPYTSFSAKNLYVGQTAEVFLEDYYQTISGKVTRITSGTRVTTDGAIVQDVEITVTNPGALTTTNTAKATIGSLESYEAGTFSYMKNVDIVAGVSGEVTKVNYDSGDKVSENAVLVKLQSDDVNMQLKNDKLSVKDAQLSLENAYEQLDNYNITSPISGTVLQKNAKAGDTIESKSSSTSSTLAIIADMSQLVFEISVDELDINKIKVGQEVSITADSLPNQTLVGSVSKISMVGTTASGVTSYPVTVVMDPVDGLLPGMNVNASIVVQKSENTLRIPIAALVNGNMVLVPNQGAVSASASEDNNKNPMASMQAPEGYRFVQVEIGISDENYVEVLSGLNEGDTIAYVMMTNTSDSEAMMRGGSNGETVVVTESSGPPEGGPGGGGPGGGM